jgi:sulfotransferase family protein
VSKEPSNNPTILHRRAARLKQFASHRDMLHRSWSPGGPTFLVVGGVKCGTFSLYEYLRPHPNVVLGLEKEIDYFNAVKHSFPDKGWYESQFRVFDKRTAEDILAIGEFTPSYCFSPCIERIRDYNPEMKLIMMVRNPVHRAISQYHMYVQQGMEARGIREALLSDGGERPEVSHAYLTRGRYHEQIELMHTSFPDSQILVRRLEDLAVAPAQVMRSVTDFLNIPALEGVEFKPWNVGNYSPAAGERELHEELRAYFLPHNVMLTEKFGIRTDDW